MQVTLEREALHEKLELVGRVSTKHVTLPVLQCVLLEAKDNLLTLKATNLEIGIEATISASVGTPGIAAVPASILSQVVHLSSQKDITLHYKDGVLLVQGAGSETKINCIPHKEFPNIPKVSGSGQVINRSLFTLGIKSTIFAASQSSIKPELGSVYIFQKKEHSLTFVATDSFRLMEKTVPQKGVVLESPVMVPQKNALEIMRACDLKEHNPTFFVDENQLALQFDDGVYITSRLVTGSFPDYQQIIPKEYVLHSTLIKEDFIHALKKTNVFLNKFFQVHLALTENAVTVSSDSGEVGGTQERIKAQTDGGDLELNFNQRYIVDALPHFVDDSITLHCAGVGRPMVIEGVSDSTMRYLVMPMNK